MGDGDAGMSDMGDVGSVSVTGSIGNGSDAFGGDGYGDMPDIGTLGGTMADMWGENSATLGGFPTDAQVMANEENSIYGRGKDPFSQAVQQVVINGLKGRGLSSLAGQAAPLVGAGINAARAPDGKRSGTFMGSLLDSTIAAPFAGLMALAGLQTPGQAVAAHGGYQGGDAPNAFSGSATDNSGQTGGMNWGSALGGLGQLYSMYSRNRDSDKFTSTLANMYGNNSPYAKQMAQSLARRDAAAGRRSQYGPREVELQAALAKAQAGVAPSVMQGQQQGFQNTMQMMQQIAALKKMGLFNTLGDMFTPKMNYAQVSQDWNPSTPIPDTGWGG